MAERYPVGTRVVTVQDHRWAELGLAAGLTGVVVEAFCRVNELIFSTGGYRILLDNCRYDVCMNASAVAKFGKGYSDADLVMAGDLANLLDSEWTTCSKDWASQLRVSWWLREQVFLELKARVR